jgi:hypothetical protein
MIVTRWAAALIGVSVFWLSTGANAQAQFNGSWSVLVVTESGNCDKAYRYPVAVENGRVRYAGEAPVSISGQVGRNGAVQGSIAGGGNRANVRGRLSGGSGSGTWTLAGGRSCSGTWSADKRG